eukprot:6189629-Pleurochrysis_carterae.AAC.1
MTVHFFASSHWDERVCYQRHPSSRDAWRDPSNRRLHRLRRYPSFSLPRCPREWWVGIIVCSDACATGHRARAK